MKKRIRFEATLRLDDKKEIVYPMNLKTCVVVDGLSRRKKLDRLLKMLRSYKMEPDVEYKTVKGEMVAVVTVRR